MASDSAGEFAMISVDEVGQQQLDEDHTHDGKQLKTKISGEIDDVDDYNGQSAGIII